MNTNDSVQVTGTINMKLIGRDGTVKDERHLKNMVVATGKKLMAERFVGTSTRNITHIALGTGSAATTSATTSLGSPIAGASVPAVLTTPQSGSVFIYSANFAAGVGTGALTEVGEFNIDGAVSTLFARTVFPVVNKAADDILFITWATTVN